MRYSPKRSIRALADRIQFNDLRRFRAVRLIEEEQFEAIGVPRVQAKIDAAIRDSRTERCACASRPQG
jgi:hypothetical protein